LRSTAKSSVLTMKPGLATTNATLRLVKNFSQTHWPTPLRHGRQLGLYQVRRLAMRDIGNKIVVLMRATNYP